MASYTANNIYSNQLQYYYPYSSSSYHSTPYGMMTDGSFQNYYYAFNGANDRARSGSGAKIFLGVLKIGLKVLGIVLGGGDMGGPTFIGGDFTQ